MIEPRTIDTGNGVTFVDMLVCDNCGAEAAEDSATGWARIDTAGVDISTMGDFPELVVCSWPCLRSVNRSFPLNTEPVQ